MAYMQVVNHFRLLEAIDAAARKFTVLVTAAVLVAA
jgi:hypothetical protein